MKEKLINSITVGLISLFFGCNPNPRDAQITKTNQEITIATLSDPLTLDPRLMRDPICATVAHMLFEGLMQKNYTGKIVPAVAENYQISEDGKTYYFSLRNAKWSDGTKVTSQDFEYTWKSILDPSFPAPNSYQFFIIKNAKKAKLGEIDLDQVGIHSIDDSTLVVELEEPINYFLELTTTHFFSPIQKKWGEMLKNSFYIEEEKIVTNGPFKIDCWNHNSEFCVVKNPYYWDSCNVHLNKITLLVSEENSALQMFNRSELDWIGSPMGCLPLNALPSLKADRKIVYTPADGVHFLRVNTEKFPLNNLNLRKALALSIDRKSIVEHITQGNQTPASGMVPLNYQLQEFPYFNDNDKVNAWTFFQESLKDLGLSRDELPQITLSYPFNERNHQLVQAIQHQWQESLGISISLEACEPALFFAKLGQHDYGMSIGSWYGDICEPINFLEILKSSENSMNNTKWQNKDYAKLLDQSVLEKDPIKKNDILAKAEKILMENFPIIPIYFPTFLHMQSNVKGVYFSPLGYLDFKYAYRE